MTQVRSLHKTGLPGGQVTPDGQRSKVTLQAPSGHRTLFNGHVSLEHCAIVMTQFPVVQSNQPGGQVTRLGQSANEARQEPSGQRRALGA